MNITHRILSLVAGALLPVLAQAGAIDQLHDFLKNTKTLKADFALNPSQRQEPQA